MKEYKTWRYYIMEKKQKAAAEKETAKKAADTKDKKPKDTGKEVKAAEAAAPAAPAVPMKPYFAGIDIVKILAVILVISVHFFLYNGFYYTPLTNTSAVGPIAMRWFAYTCVPLFMISTGYLMKNKTLSAKYYTGIIKIIVIYLVISVICLKFKQDIQHYEFKNWDIFKGFLEYSNAQYGWYINYYIALFLAIPFINLAFNGCKNNKQKFIMTFTVFAFTIFARSFFLGFDRDTQIKALPDYLNGAWPLAYYYVGAFIRDCPPKRNIRNKLIVFACFCASLGFLTWSTYKQSVADVENEQHFLSWHFNDYGTYPVFLVAVCIFLLLFDITTKNKGVKFVLRQLSGVTLATYLISYIFDNMFYNSWQKDMNSERHIGFNEKYAEVGERLGHWYEVVPKIFICSLISAIVIHKLYDLCVFLLKKGVEAAKAEKEATAVEK